MNKLLLNLLRERADEISNEGIDGLFTTSAQDHLDIEDLLNAEISEATDPELDSLLRIRFLFRILRKYQIDLDRGIDELIKYQS